MPKRTGNFDSWQEEKLSDPALATRYLTAVLEEAPQQFLVALGKVARASQMSVVAKKSGVAREHLYQSLSDKGNVTWSTLLPVLKALGLKLEGVVAESGAIAAPSSSGGVVGTRKQLRKKYGRRGFASASPAQLSLRFERFEVVRATVGTAGVPSRVSAGVRLNSLVDQQTYSRSLVAESALPPPWILRPQAQAATSYAP
jgi:probable addiction module antidote protein